MTKVTKRWPQTDAGRSKLAPRGAESCLKGRTLSQEEPGGPETRDRVTLNFQLSKDVTLLFLTITPA